MSEEFKNLKEIIELCKTEIEEKNENINATLDYIDLKELYCLLECYNQEKETSHYIQNKLDEANAKLLEKKEKNKKLEETINNLAKALKFMGTNDELTADEIIKMFSPEEIKMNFDDFIQRWEKEQYKERNLKDKVIDMMAEDITKPFGKDFEVSEIIKRRKEECKQYYFKKARGEEDVKD